METKRKSGNPFIQFPYVDKTFSILFRVVSCRFLGFTLVHDSSLCCQLKTITKTNVFINLPIQKKHFLSTFNNPLSDRWYCFLYLLFIIHKAWHSDKGKNYTISWVEGERNYQFKTVKWIIHAHTLTPHLYSSIVRGLIEGGWKVRPSAFYDPTPEP